MTTQVTPDTRERMTEKYGDRYAYENCQTIGCIFKEKLPEPEELPKEIYDE